MASEKLMKMLREKFIEIDELSPWEIDDLTHKAKEYFAPYMGKDAKRIKSYISDGRRVCRCFRCGGEARVTGILATSILCDVCGTYAYQLNDGAAVHVYVSNAVHKYGKLIELFINRSEPEYTELSIPVDPNDREDLEWLNNIIGA